MQYLAVALLKHQYLMPTLHGLVLLNDGTLYLYQMLVGGIELSIEQDTAGSSCDVFTEAGTLNHENLLQKNTCCKNKHT